MHTIRIIGTGVVWTGESQNGAYDAFRGAVGLAQLQTKRVVWMVDGEVIGVFNPNPSYNPVRNGR